MAELSEYERARAEKIAQNQKLLANMGLSPIKDVRQKRAGDAAAAKAAKKVKQGSASPVRISARAKPKVNYAEERVMEEEVTVAPAGSAIGGRNGVRLPEAEVETKKRPVPDRSADGTLIFIDHPEFYPNLTPKEVLQLGSFGGTYFRPIKSGVTGQSYEKQHEEFPVDWLKGLVIQREVASPKYRTEVNKYGVSCGGDLNMWESSGWIRAPDVYGWFHWYCRFYLGRRSQDDARQISRWAGVAGKTGRFRIQLINKIFHAGGLEKINDHAISPVIRQTLQHWGYVVNERDYKERIKSNRPK